MVKQTILSDFVDDQINRESQESAENSDRKEKSPQEYVEPISSNLPEEWLIDTIEECCDILDFRRIPLSEETRRNMKGRYPYYGANGVLDYINDYIFDDDLILLAEDGGHFEEYRTRPIAYIVSGKCWVNNHAHVLRAKTGYCREWIFYNLVHRNLIPFIHGSTRSKLNQRELRTIPIPVPPFPEQQKIAAILSSIDETIQKTQSIIDHSQKLKRGLMQQLFTKGIGHTKFKKTEIGEIPETWDTVGIKNICNIRRGASPRPINSPRYFAEMGRGWVRISDVTSSFKYLRKTEQYLSKLGESKSVKVNPGELIMSICATVGRPIIVDMEACIHDGFVVFKNLSSEIHTEFIFYYIQKIEGKLTSMGQYGTQRNLNTKLVGSEAIPLPPLLEQQKIASILSAIDRKIEKEQQYKSQLEKLKKGLMQNLLTGKVRVKVDK
jgi:type I restriction enzyme S subunit